MRPLILFMSPTFRKWGTGKKRKKWSLAGMDTAFIAENVYLYCASENLPTCFRLSIDREKLGQALKLRPTQKIMGCSECRTSERQIVEWRTFLCEMWQNAPLLRSISESGLGMNWFLADCICFRSRSLCLYRCWKCPCEGTRADRAACPRSRRTASWE